MQQSGVDIHHFTQIDDQSVNNGWGFNGTVQRVTEGSQAGVLEMEMLEKKPNSKNNDNIGLFRRFYVSKRLFQFKALFIKEMQLHSKHIYASLCHVTTHMTQIFTPVLILVLLKLLMDRLTNIANITIVDFQRRPLIPLVHNMPLSLVKQSSFYPIATNTCHKWFSYDYDESLVKLNRVSMIEKIINDPLREYCPEIGRHTPYFKRSSSPGIVADLSAAISKLNQQAYKFGKEVESVGEIPDGCILFKDIDADIVDVRLMINDMPLTEYHSNNGVTKSSFKLSKAMASKANDAVDMRKRLENSNATWPVCV